MGCGTSSTAAKDGELAVASPIVPGPAAAASTQPKATVAEEKQTADGSAAATAVAPAATPQVEVKQPEPEPVRSDEKKSSEDPTSADAPAAVAPVTSEEVAPTPAPSKEEEVPAKSLAPVPSEPAPVEPSSSASAGDATVRAAVTKAHETALLLFASATLENVDTIALDASFDTPSSGFIGELEISLLVDYFTSGSSALFSEAIHTLEISQSILAELCLVTGSAEETIRLLTEIDKRGEKFEQISDLPHALQSQQRMELQSNIEHLSSKQLQSSILDAYDLLAKPTCGLHTYAVLPSASNPSGAEEQTSELDFNTFNTLALPPARTRLLFLAPAYLTALTHACGRNGSGTRIILDFLGLAEREFHLPNELVKAAIKLRLESTSTFSYISPTGTLTVPSTIQSQVLPLQKALWASEPACMKLEPKLEAVRPQLQQIKPNMKHLQVYLARFLPLLQESLSQAKESSLTPETDESTKEILHAYFIPFLRLLQPWLLQTRPFLASLQPFFTEIQPFLGGVHQAFTPLLPFVHDLRGVVNKDASFLLGESNFRKFLQGLAGTLSKIHPLLQQLHPLMDSLREFMTSLNELLTQLSQLLDLILAYQTIAPEPLPPRDPNEEYSRSSIAVPWVEEEEGEEDAGEDATTSTLPTPAFLAKHGRALPKIKAYVEQLRPFAGEVREFVEKFVPFVVQLAPFYRDGLKSSVVPTLLYLVPSDQLVAAESVPQSAVTKESSETPATTAQQPEMDEAALQRLLSS